ncbi:MAG TPA: hypothetical protein PKW33_11870 [Anaerolineaceae bacterium]|nr:hypothetical protein [Anaerolineaceae bacterium]HPN52277.1 hypothetical protein [Anaerolineaceae bacterium]
MNYLGYNDFVPCLYREMGISENTFRRTGWKQTCHVLYTMALRGWSVWSDLVANSKINRTTSAKILQELEKAGLIQTGEYLLSGNTSKASYFAVKFKVIELSSLGRSCCTNVGWTPIESEWARLRRLHEPKNQISKKHSACVLHFAHHARLRGWEATVLPDISETNSFFQPDVEVIQHRPYHEDARIMVEVESRHYPNRQNKWWGMNTICEKISAGLGLVTYGYSQILHLTAEVRNMGIHAYATDIKSLREDVARLKSTETPQNPIRYSDLPLFNIVF